ncbi:MAG: hypothetical protein JSS99_15145 [Actinobacteria bacterium]|nr:hypothetical protein [Actinomycetota bacterium]
MPPRRPDNVQRGVLAEKIRARAKRPKITDPEEVKKMFERIGIDLPPGANTVRRRTRY